METDFAFLISFSDGHVSAAAAGLQSTLGVTRQLIAFFLGEGRTGRI